MTIEELNATDRRAFVEAIGWVFEHSPWVAERAWEHRPFEHVEALHEAMKTQVASATPDEQLALLRAHPDLGARATMSDASSTEQAGAGLDGLSGQDFDRLTALNVAYRDKFGFPFLYAVKGSTKQDILNALETRLPASRGTELGEALRQVYRIAGLRLEGVIS